MKNLKMEIGLASAENYTGAANSPDPSEYPKGFVPG
jgi:hypothetical protein